MVGYAITNHNGKYLVNKNINGKYYTYYLVNHLEESDLYTQNKALNMLGTVPSKYKPLGKWAVEKFEINNNSDNDVKQNTFYDFSKYEINIENIDLNNISNSIKDNSSKLKIYFAKLEHEITQNLYKLRDIRHKIENTNMSASDGYILCKLMQDYLRERRVLKNKAQKCKVLFGLNIASIATENVEALFEDIDNKRKYKPRLLDNIFDD